MIGVHLHQRNSIREQLCLHWALLSAKSNEVKCTTEQRQTTRGSTWKISYLLKQWMLSQICQVWWTDSWRHSIQELRKCDKLLLPLTTHVILSNLTRNNFISGPRIIIMQNKKMHLSKCFSGPKSVRSNHLLQNSRTCCSKLKYFSVLQFKKYHFCPLHITLMNYTALRHDLQFLEDWFHGVQLLDSKLKKDGYIY